MIRTIEMPNAVEFDLPGKSYASTSADNTPNVEKFQGTTKGTLEPSKDTYGKIFIVPTPLSEKGGTTVDWEQLISEDEGTHIATISIDGEETEVYATGGAGDLTQEQYDYLIEKIKQQ